MKILAVCGARPNFMKIAPLLDAFASHPEIEALLVHTGQHYDEKMSDMFFRELGIPEPDVHLGVGSGSQAVQTAEVMIRFEPVVVEQKPDWVVVVGDVNSTIACALVAAKLGVRVAHVEAGLRSFDWGMPEEINRVVTDRLSDLLLVSERSGLENLAREGIPADKIRFVGNVMIDTLLKHRERAAGSRICEELEVDAQGYVAVTLHRPSNVDRVETLAPLVQALGEISIELPVVFPVHPRTRQRIDEAGLRERLPANAQMKWTEPLGYLDFLKLMSDARAVITDSGGLQEETTILGVPCLTLRENTERPVTITEGTNQLVKPDSPSLLAAWRALAEAPAVSGGTPELWDGHAGERIAEALLRS